MLRRLIGVSTFRAGAYRELAERSRLQWDPILLVVVLSTIDSLAYAALHGLTFAAVSRLLYPILAWALYGYLGSFLLRVLARTDVPAFRLLNIFGYTQAAGALGILLTTVVIGLPGLSAMGPVRILVSTLSLILLAVSIVAGILGFREGGRITTLQAVIIFVVTFVAILLIQSAIGALARVA